MPIFTILYKDNSSQTFEAESKESLIRDFSMNDATAFQEDVLEIQWEKNGHYHSENISSGKITTQKNDRKTA